MGSTDLLQTNLMALKFILVCSFPMQLNCNKKYIAPEDKHGFALKPLHVVIKNH